MALAKKFRGNTFVKEEEETEVTEWNNDFVFVGFC